VKPLDFGGHPMLTTFVRRVRLVVGWVLFLVGVPVLLLGACLWELGNLTAGKELSL